MGFHHIINSSLDFAFEDFDIVLGGGIDISHLLKQLQGVLFEFFIRF